MSGETHKSSILIFVAMIGALATCLAAIIGLGVPIVSRLADIYLPVVTPTSIIVQGQATQPPTTVQPTATVQQAPQQPTVIVVTATPSSTPVQEPPSAMPTATPIPPTSTPTATRVPPTPIHVLPTPFPISSSLCVGLVARSEVDAWAQVGSTDKATAQRYIADNFGSKEKDIGFVKGDTVPAGVLIATDFGNGESEVYLSYPVKPVVHYRSWGLFETTGSFVALYPGACLIIR